jgi:hypothetical protein
MLKKKDLLQWLESLPIASAKKLFFLDLIRERVITSLYMVLSYPNPYHQP